MTIDEILQPFVSKYQPQVLKEIKQSLYELIKEKMPKKKACGGDNQMNDEYEQCHGFNNALDDVTKALSEIFEGTVKE